eukprot:6161582-Pyramimonas_sp.AAC.1
MPPARDRLRGGVQRGPAAHRSGRKALGGAAFLPLAGRAQNARRGRAGPSEGRGAGSLLPVGGAV